MQHPVLIFLSGRAVSLVVLLAFQIVVARNLPAREYAAYALVFALATLAQTVVSFGIPRVISRHIGGAGEQLTSRSAARLLGYSLAFRLASTLVILIAGGAIAFATGLIEMPSPGLLAAATFYILAGVLQIDSDSAAQALGLQRLSRRAMITEAIARLALVVVALKVFAEAQAATLVAIAALTLGLAGIYLAIGGFRKIGRLVDGPEAVPIDKQAVYRTAAGGYAGTLAWFASSPAVIRLIAAKVLGVSAFAGFSFAQSLVTSFQRYTPGALLYPFVEPTVMRSHARRGETALAEGALSIVPLADMLLVGAALCGAMVAAEPVVAWMTAGKYTEQAWVIPWLLAYMMTVPAFRSLEIAAVALGQTRALGTGLAISIAWGVMTFVAGWQFGLIALVVGPIADAVCRIGWLWLGLRRRGLGRIVEFGRLALLFALVLSFGGLGRFLANMLGGGALPALACGCSAAFCYLITASLLRPFTPVQADLLASHLPRRVASLIGRLVR